VDGRVPDDDSGFVARRRCRANILSSAIADDGGGERT
jgi:hypothetical protein